MNVSYKVREWLQTAFTDQVDLINESYYIDRIANEFYSVFITDYFLTDPNSTEDYPNSPYSTDELVVLSARIDRQQNNDSSIVVVPRLTLEERKEMMKTFLDEQQNYDPSIRNLIETENGRTNLDFDKLLSGELNERWQQLKWDFVQDKIESFCNLQNINLETATVWTDKKMTTMTLDVNEKPPDLKQEVIIRKPWWKFW